MLLALKHSLSLLIKNCYRLIPKSILLNKIGWVAIGERVRPNPLWIAVDAVSADYQVIIGPDTELPFESECISAIHNSHNLEHCTDEAAEQLVKECARVLKKNGELMIEVPDAQFFYEQARAFFLDGQTENNIFSAKPIISDQVIHNLKRKQPSITIEEMFSPQTAFIGSIASYCQPKFVGHLTPAFVANDDLTRNLAKMEMTVLFDWILDQMSDDERASGGHCSYWTWKKLSSLLERHGFDVQKRKFKQSAVVPSFLVPDRRHRQEISIVISAVKAKIH